MNQQFIPLRDVASQIDHLHVASLIAHVRPEYLIHVREWMMGQPQDPIRIEIHAQSEQGKLVIVTESSEEKAIVNFLDDLRSQPGVLNAALVYHEYLTQHDLRDELQKEGSL
jgi:periplasmic nitrate reductase NapD